MTIDMLVATVFCPEGTLLHIPEELPPEEGALDPPRDAEDPVRERLGATFWATVLRQIGWPLPPRSATHG